jgi:hypothetical protein
VRRKPSLLSLSLLEHHLASALASFEMATVKKILMCLNHFMRPHPSTPAK